MSSVVKPIILDETGIAINNTLSDICDAIEAMDSGIYGVTWDGTTTSAWTRTDDAANFSAPVPYVSGASDWGSPFDGISPWKDMTIVEDAEAGTMVKIPKFYYKLEQITGGGMSIKISKMQHEGYCVCPACMNRGDGDGEHDYILVGRYHSASDYKSKTGATPIGSITRPTARTGCHALGSKVWMLDFSTWFTIWLLYLVEYADFNSQGKIGLGTGDSSIVASGYTDSMPYHTGTTQTRRDRFGIGTQYRHLEGLWDNILDFLGCCYNNSDGTFVILNPANDSDTTGGANIGPNISLGIPSAFGVSSALGVKFFAPTAVGSTTSQVSCDTWYIGSSFPCLCVGGDRTNSLNSGLFRIDRTQVNQSTASVGTRLMKLV